MTVEASRNDISEANLKKKKNQKLHLIIRNISSNANVLFFLFLMSREVEVEDTALVSQHQSPLMQQLLSNFVKRWHELIVFLISTRSLHRTKFG